VGGAPPSPVAPMRSRFSVPSTLEVGNAVEDISTCRLVEIPKRTVFRESVRIFSWVASQFAF